MADIDPLTQLPVAQPVVEPMAQPQLVAPQQQMPVAAPQQEMLMQQQPVAIAAQQVVQPQPVAQLVAAQATVAALLFSSGAVLIAISRGIANGRGQVGLSLSEGTWSSANKTYEEPNKDGEIKTKEEETVEVLETMFNDDNVHARWEHRRQSQC